MPIVELKPEPIPKPKPVPRIEPKPVPKSELKPEPKPEHSPEPLPRKPFLEPISEQHKPESITVTTPKHKPKEKIVEKTNVELPKYEQKSEEKIDTDIKIQKDASEKVLPKVHVDSPKSPIVTQIQKSEKSSIPIKNQEK